MAVVKWKHALVGLAALLLALIPVSALAAGPPPCAAFERTPGDMARSTSDGTVRSYNYVASLTRKCDRAYGVYQLCVRGVWVQDGSDAQCQKEPEPEGDNGTAGAEGSGAGAPDTFTTVAGDGTQCPNFTAYPGDTPTSTTDGTVKSFNYVAQGTRKCDSVAENYLVCQSGHWVYDGSDNQCGPQPEAREAALPEVEGLTEKIEQEEAAADATGTFCYCLADRAGEPVFAMSRIFKGVANTCGGEEANLKFGKAVQKAGKNVNYAVCYPKPTMEEALADRDLIRVGSPREYLTGVFADEFDNGERDFAPPKRETKRAQTACANPHGSPIAEGLYVCLARDYEYHYCRCNGGTCQLQVQGPLPCGTPGHISR